MLTAGRGGFRLRRPLLCLLAVVALVLAATPAVAWEPQQGAKFNVPKPWGLTGTQKFRIQRHVDQAVSRTRPTAADPRPVILITSFLMDRRDSVAELVRACRRGVSVRVILDDAIDNRNSKRLIKVLNADNVEDEDGDGKPDRPPRTGPCNSALEPTPRARAVTREPWGERRLRDSLDVPTGDDLTWGGDRSYVTQCTGSCRGGRGHMHSKFYAFSTTGSARDVVMVSSANLNKGGGTRGWNDIYTMVDRPASFALYRRIHREMTEDVRAGRGRVELVDGRFTSRFFPMRNATRRNDPALEDLNRIGCRSAFGRTEVHVNMFGWKGKRGRYMADKLFSLKRNGCQVSIIFGAPSLVMSKYLKKQARKHRVPLFNSRRDFDGDGIKEVRAHSKYVIVKGRYGRDASSHQVLTGSANWVDGGLDRGDESTLNIASRAAYRQYLRNWHVVRRHSVRS
jgi:hypothetical protein